jgi:phosphoribosyl-AMP cyclohydrolase
MDPDSRMSCHDCFQTCQISFLPYPARVNDESHSCFAPRLDKKQIEDGLEFAPKFDENGLLAAVAIDAHTREPLMLAWMNRESLRLTLEKGEAVYWSRSRQEIWHKGATSGQIQKVIEMRTDCDQDAVILYVEQAGGGACHTGRNSCFYRSIHPGCPAALRFLQQND